MKLSEIESDKFMTVLSLLSEEMNILEIKEKLNINGTNIEILLKYLFSSKDIAEKNINEIVKLYREYYDENQSHIVSIIFFINNCLNNLPDNSNIGCLLNYYKERVEELDNEMKEGMSKSMLYKIIDLLSPNKYNKLAYHYELCKFLISFKAFPIICKENIKSEKYRNLSIILSTLIKHDDVDSLKIAVNSGLDINV